MRVDDFLTKILDFSLGLRSFVSIVFSCVRLSLLWVLGVKTCTGIEVFVHFHRGDRTLILFSHLVGAKFV